MTNVNDTDADLGLAVNIANIWKNSNINIAAGSGAGANANSWADMMSFVGSDTLAELVWSPQTGLNIKFAGKKPSFILDVGPSDVGILRSENTQDGKQIRESRSVASLASCHVSGEVVKSSSSGEADPLSKRLFDNGMTSGVDGPVSDNKSPLKVEAITQCGPQKHVESSNTGMDTVKLEKGGSQDATFENEKTAENGGSLVGEDKEKSFDCRENDENLEVESHGSMESCKSANLLTKKRPSFEHPLILGSKRVKKQGDYSSFTSWISNMLKGVKNHENYDKKIGVCDKTSNLESRKMGFHNVFQSLYLPDVKAQKTIAQIENKSVDSLEIKEKHISLYERLAEEAPKGMFDTIRRLRLSRTDILKWSNSRSSVGNLDGFFLRLRVAKLEEETGGSRYYVACITGLQGKKRHIRVKVGGVECFVESQYVSNCDFLEDELVAWWRKTSKNGGTPVVKDLKSKLAERRTMGL